MNPRLESSTKWTKVPQELLLQIKEVLTENFPQFKDRGKFIAEGQLYPSELLLRIGFIESGRLKQNNFESSIEYDFKQENMLQLIHFSVDCTASMMTEFFDDEATEFPQEWTSYEVEKREIFLKHSTLNTQLEAEADALLGELEDDLVGTDNEDEELRARITMLGLDDDDVDGLKKH